MIASAHITMNTFRTLNPKPPLFNLLHRWNLSYAEQQSLKHYVLRSITAQKLAANLDQGRGVLWIWFGEKQYDCVPIYQNVSRNTIKSDSPTAKYWLSIRVTKTGEAVVLIQREL